jgi:2-C-methyl-D-erythritol 4-phosphate cytidylyltransferase
LSTWAVLVAAGRGERLGGDRPKAFAPLRGRPLLAESLERLEASDWIDAIVVVAPEGWEEPSILVAEELGCGKVSATVTGGASRAESVRLGVAEADRGAAALVVHDAARPLVPEDVIERVLTPLGEGWDGAVPGVPVADTIKRVDGERVVETLARDELRAVQTPQAFAADVLRAARGARVGRERLCVARRGSRRAGRRRPRRPAAAQDHDTRGSRARRVLARGRVSARLSVSAGSGARHVPGTCRAPGLPPGPKGPRP